MNKICRTCLSGEGPLFPLHATPATRDISICDMISSLVYVEMHQGDGLPDDICQSCLEKVTLAYNFKLLCERTDAVLREAGPIGGSSKFDEALLDTNLLSPTEIINNPQTMHNTQLEESSQIMSCQTIPTSSLLILNTKHMDTVPQQGEQTTTVEVYEVTEGGDLMLVGAKLSQIQKQHHEIAVRNPDKQQLCAVCGKRFTHISGLRQHSRLHFHTSQAPLPCLSCSRTFPTAAALRAHQHRTHSSSCQPSQLCPHCGKVFSATLLRTHLKIHTSHPSSRRLHSCPHCPRSYTRLSYLRFHLSSAHGDPTQPPPRVFPCPHAPCNRRLPTKHSLQIHIKHKHTSDRPFTCSVCPKAFASQAGLKEHLRVHNGDKNKSCTICGGKFVTKQSLDAHYRLHTGERPYVCSECGEGFVSSSRRLEHFQSKHSQQSHVCPTCGKMFHLRRTLNVHMKAHDRSLNSNKVPEAGFEIIVK